MCPRGYTTLPGLAQRRREPPKEALLLARAKSSISTRKVDGAIYDGLTEPCGLKCARQSLGSAGQPTVQNIPMETFKKTQNLDSELTKTRSWTDRRIIR